MQGSSGVAGAQGATGVVGAQGATGVAGAQGATGVAGAQGATGISGASGHQGSTGATGMQGVAGNQGPQGVTGAQGVTGIVGEVGHRALLARWVLVGQPARRESRVFRVLRVRPGWQVPRGHKDCRGREATAPLIIFRPEQQYLEWLVEISIRLPALLSGVRSISLRLCPRAHSVNQNGCYPE